MKKYRMPLLVVAIAIAILAVPVVASASHAWGGYHWERSANPVALTIGDNVSSTWDDNLDVAIADWNLSSVLSLTKVDGKAKRNCRPGNGRIEICADTYGFNGWLGLAGISVSGGHITKAYAKMNDSYFNAEPYNTDAWRQMVMCQEIGHDFGLAHQDEQFTNPNLGTCMDYTNDPGSNQHPNAHDYEQLGFIYAHLDVEEESGGGKPPWAGGPNKRSAPGLINSEWGKAIGVDGNGRPNVFELDLGNGNKELTHVLWAN